MNSTQENKNLQNGKKRNKIPVTWSPEKQTNKKLRQGIKIIVDSMQTLKHGWILASGVKELKQTTKLVQFTDFKVKYWFCANRNNNNHIKNKNKTNFERVKKWQVHRDVLMFPFCSVTLTDRRKVFLRLVMKKKENNKKKIVFMSVSPSRRCSGGKIKMLGQAVFWGWRRRDVI